MPSPRALDAVVARYLARLNRSLGSVDPERRRQIVEEVAQHIAESRSRMRSDDRDSLLSLLERMGSPEAIAAEAAGLGTAPPAAWDGWIPWLLLLGGFLFGVGWLVGVVALWASSAWRFRDKLLGTLVLPGGLAGTVALAALPSSTTVCTQSAANSALHCVSTGFRLPLPVGLGVLVVAALAPVAVAIHLERVRRAFAPAGWSG